MQKDFKDLIQEKIDTKTKPLGALGMLEKLAFQIALVQNSLAPTLNAPHIIVFAGSHGIASRGVSAYPSEVTAQMVLNFLQGGAAINVLTRQHGIALTVVDAGVDFEFENHENLVHAKVGFGTKNFLESDAMTDEECVQCFENGAGVVKKVAQSGCNVIGFGEMGIGNTSSAAVIMSKLLGLPIRDCVGKGTGLNDAQLDQKIALLQKAIDFHNHVNASPEEVLRTFGGFEMAMMCGAMLEAGKQNMLLLVDGFIASVAYLCASQMMPELASNAVYCHQSDEKGHLLLLEKLHAKPVLNLGMRLGEGTGCAVAYPILQSAVAFFNEMASFESAGVSNQTA